MHFPFISFAVIRGILGFLFMFMFVFREFLFLTKSGSLMDLVQSIMSL